MKDEKKDREKQLLWTGKIQVEITAKINIVREKKVNKNLPFSALQKPLLLKWFAIHIFKILLSGILSSRKMSVNYLKPKYFPL